MTFEIILQSQSIHTDEIDFQSSNIFEFTRKFLLQFCHVFVHLRPINHISSELQREIYPFFVLLV